jgi:ankyrin repeat protein
MSDCNNLLVHPKSLIRIDPSCEHVVERTGDINANKQINGFTPLGFAAQEGYLEICAFLIMHLDDKNPGEKNGWTPLHRAV